MTERIAYFGGYRPSPGFAVLPDRVMFVKLVDGEFNGGGVTDIIGAEKYVKDCIKEDYQIILSDKYFKAPLPEKVNSKLQKALSN